LQRFFLRAVPAKQALSGMSGEASRDASLTTEQPGLFAALHTASGAHELGLTLEEFTAILREIGTRYLPANASEAELLDFCRGLQLQDLALARACAKGSEIAWERFIERYRPKIRHAAHAIAGHDSKAHELADSLYAQLFGTKKSAECDRVSKFAFYTGRGSLEGWLRTVLAQEHVNELRRERRLVSFDERIHEAASPITVQVQQRLHSRIEQAIDSALAKLAAEERLILASYYLDDRTLAAIARILGVHESTVSRRLDKITRGLRKRIMRALGELGMTSQEIKEAMQCDVRGLSIDIRSRLGARNSGARNAE
jgi:RNA polymerase sigma-70 factor, ECF subfamily